MNLRRLEPSAGSTNVISYAPNVKTAVFEDEKDFYFICGIQTDNFSCFYGTDGTQILYHG